MPVHLLWGMTRDLQQIVVEESINATAIVEEDVSATAVIEENVTAIISECGMTTTQNLSIVRGDSRTWKFTCKDENDVVIDITDAKVWFTVKEDLSQDDTFAKFQRRNADAGGSAAEIEMSDPTNGEFKVHVVPANTNGIDLDTIDGTLKFDAQVQMPSGKTYTVTEGKFTISEDVTRTTS